MKKDELKKTGKFTAQVTVMLMLLFVMFEIFPTLLSGGTFDIIILIALILLIVGVCYYLIISRKK